jgi:hypothetical protein
VYRCSQVLQVQFLVLPASLVYRPVGAMQAPVIAYFFCHILKVRSWFPAVVLWWVSFPLYQICVSLFVVFQDFLNFVFLLFCFLAVGGRWVLVRSVSGVKCLKFVNGEPGVNFQCIWYLQQTISSIFIYCEDAVRSYPNRVQLLRLLLGNIPSLIQDIVSFLKADLWIALFSYSFGRSFLSHSFFNFYASHRVESIVSAVVESNNKVRSNKCGELGRNMP